MLSRLKFEFPALVDEMLSQIPESVFVSDSTTFLDPEIGGGQFIKAIETKLRSYGHSNINIASRVIGLTSDKFDANFAKRKNIHGDEIVGQIFVADIQKTDIVDEQKNKMKFDVIIGNPPYQTANNAGGNSKLYNLISSKAISLLNPTGVISFITPTSVLKDSRQFTLINMPGLKSVDFTADDYFNVGVKIVQWTIDCSYTGGVAVKDKTGTRKQPAAEAIYDHSIVDPEFIKLFNGLKLSADSFENRMFKRAFRGTDDSPVKKDNYVFSYRKINSDGTTCISYFMKNAPKYGRGKKKLVISRTKTITEDNMIVDNRDYDCNHVFVEINNIAEARNIKSFILSDYFKQHSYQWRKTDGYGFNNALTYLPPFDKTKSWTNDEVREFIESFVK